MNFLILILILGIGGGMIGSVIHHNIYSVLEILGCVAIVVIQALFLNWFIDRTIIPFWNRFFRKTEQDPI